VENSSTFRSESSGWTKTEEEKREHEKFMRRCANHESVEVGKNYIEINRAPGASLPIFEMVPMSEIVSVYYY
jgi:hypothetical protein